jgi:hypothetical protein
MEPRTQGEQFELLEEGPCSDASGDGVCLPEWRFRLGAGSAGRDERLGFTPAAVGRKGRALELLPGIRGVRPELGPGDAAGTLVLGLGEGTPAHGARCDR